MPMEATMSWSHMLEGGGTDTGTCRVCCAAHVLHERLHLGMYVPKAQMIRRMQASSPWFHAGQHWAYRRLPRI